MAQFGRTRDPFIAPVVSTTASVPKDSAAVPPDLALDMLFPDQVKEGVGMLEGSTIFPPATHEAWDASGPILEWHFLRESPRQGVGAPGGQAMEGQPDSCHSLDDWWFSG
jgi:hypothetical protein